MHDVLFACHARLDVHKYDSSLRRFTVAQTGTPSDWSQLEVGVIHVSCATNTLAHNILRNIQLCPEVKTLVACNSFNGSFVVHLGATKVFNQ